MPLTVDAVVIYLGIVLAGCVVVSIADSFAAEEVAVRLRIAGAAAVFTQVGSLRAGLACCMLPAAGWQVPAGRIQAHMHGNPCIMP